MNYLDYSYNDINQYFSQYELLTIVYPGLSTGKQSAPYRKDNNPSFILSIENNQKIRFKDFGTGDSGDFWQLVKISENCSFNDAIEFVNMIIRTGNHKPMHQRSYLKASKEPIPIGVHKTEWNINQELYWHKYAIKKEHLLHYNISPIDWYYYYPNTAKEACIKSDDIAFVYEEFKDGVDYLKIYQPYSKVRKWISNNKADVWENWNQIKIDSELFILQKSKKDSMCIQVHTSFASANLSAESLYPKPHVLQEIKDKFKNIIILYDNDYDKKTNWGRNFSERVSELTSIPRIEVPDKYESKNYSDLIEKYGLIEANKILNSLL